MTVNLTNLKGSIINRLATEKKKVFVAAVLIALMIFMWAKLLVGQKPQSVAAALSQGAPASNNANNKDSSVTFVELPFEEGRHDVLSRDFFNIESAVFSASEQVNIVSSDGGREQIQVIADKLKLDAISMAPEQEAFINDRLVKVGDVLVVTDGSKSYECEIVKIDCLKVLVRCEKAEIELKLKQPDEF
ncbi:MAG: hypothetical protein JW804_01060 [Sedimentisphaerales bacterium]|nr:hypothetical protein [Sedimentisphaerales bacterium]